MSALVAAGAAGAAVWWWLWRPPWPWRVAELAEPPALRPVASGGAEPPAGAEPSAGAAGAPPRRWAAPSGWARPAGGAERLPAGAPADLAECADLLHVAAAAGCSVLDSIDVVVAAVTVPGATAQALARVRADFDRGVGLVDAVDRLPDSLGPAARPLVAALVASLTAGVPLAPAARSVADAERLRRRRAVEVAVRRLPTRLLLPLVGLVLPAFVLVALVPTVAAVAGASAEWGLAPAGPVRSRAVPIGASALPPSAPVGAPVPPQEPNP